MHTITAYRLNDSISAFRFQGDPATSTFCARLDENWDEEFGNCDFFDFEEAADGRVEVRPGEVVIFMPDGDEPHFCGVLNEVAFNSLFKQVTTYEIDFA